MFSFLLFIRLQIPFSVYYDPFLVAAAQQVQQAQAQAAAANSMNAAQVDPNNYRLQVSLVWIFLNIFALELRTLFIILSLDIRI